MYRGLLWLCFLPSLLFGQRTDSLRIDFRPLLNGVALELEEEGGASAGAREVEVLRFYLSELQLLEGEEVVFAEEDHHHLIDAAQVASLQLPLTLPPGLRYDGLRFTLGVDSLTAASGVFGGDLDPTNGMYWTWRSGYINFKLEGTSPDCPARKQRFQFHVGGFQAPFNSERRVTLAIKPARSISIIIDLDSFFADTDLSQQYQVMSPGELSMKVADRLTRMFRVE
ncbi:MbnP family protein [Neolewinella agarilytica]|uniref:MbnP family protein n=1 Tax=Neolewinella agarilytica TaxID=478744 RepID=UPI002353DA29|nr:MbnP family protein [Neolewinella agarilytica]